MLRALSSIVSRLSAFTFLTLLLLPAAALAHGISDEQKQRMLEGGYGHYVILGAEHMLTGYDHLLFLFGVLFFLSTFKEVAKFVTVFTIGHCITLIFATFFRMRLSEIKLFAHRTLP